MIYVLIVMWYGWTQGTSGKAAIAVEFNSMKACQAAAAEIKKQSSPDVLVCAEKGVKQP